MNQIANEIVRFCFEQGIFQGKGGNTQAIYPNERLNILEGLTDESLTAILKLMHGFSCETIEDYVNTVRTHGELNYIIGLYPGANGEPQVSCGNGLFVSMTGPDGFKLTGGSVGNRGTVVISENAPEMRTLLNASQIALDSIKSKNRLYTPVKFAQLYNLAALSQLVQTDNLKFMLDNGIVDEFVQESLGVMLPGINFSSITCASIGSMFVKMNDMRKYTDGLLKYERVLTIPNIDETEARFRIFQIDRNTFQVQYDLNTGFYISFPSIWHDVSGDEEGTNEYLSGCKMIEDDNIYQQIVIQGILAYWGWATSNLAIQQTHYSMMICMPLEPYDVLIDSIYKVRGMNKPDPTLAELFDRASR